MKDLIRSILREQTKKRKYAVRDLRNDSSYEKIFWLFISEIKNTEDAYSKRKLIESMYNVFQKWTDRPAQYISKKIADNFIENKPNVDPFQLLHTDRFSLGKSDIKGSLMVWEHTTPIAGFLKDFVTSNSIEEVKEKMGSYSGICWVTRDEDLCLYRNKFHSKRPEGWRAAYSSCGIEPLTKLEYESYKTKKLNSIEEDPTN